tara:strand:+ start:38098 stop:38388 length:291 start_codon:yes stop_codon:yes gene_type:complete
MKELLAVKQALRSQLKSSPEFALGCWVEHHQIHPEDTSIIGAYYHYVERHLELFPFDNPLSRAIFYTLISTYKLTIDNMLFNRLNNSASSHKELVL